MSEQTAGYVAKTTPDLRRDQIERLKRIFPECVTEDKIDFEMLRATLGDAGALAGQDAYTFTWAGKQDAFRAIQTPSAAALRPAPDESIDFDDTHHIFIEGENLEVLKLLYKSYFGQVKMIYIDPPYNTGHDFVYRDDYREPRLPGEDRPGGRRGQSADQQPRNQRPLPLRLAVDDVPALVPGPPTTPRRWRDLREH
jgi:adenine-specific DNA-methyltransferase